MNDTLQTTTTTPATASASSASKPRRGFALMDPNQLRAVSSKGGSAPHTAKRGFALMDENRRREVSQKGLLARRGAFVADDIGRTTMGEDSSGA